MSSIPLSPNVGYTPRGTPLQSLTYGYEALTPPRRLRVSESVSQTLMIDQPGGYTGLWNADQTPYMVEPMDKLASRRHEAVCFVGPARTGKTMALLDGWMAHAVTCDPGDMLIVQMSQEKAREFSKVRVDRAIRHSPQLREMMSARGHDDNTHDKMFRHGMWVKIGWPSASQLSSSDYRYVALTDYDRMPENIDGEGAAFGLGLKRTQTFLSRGMCMVESSPGREVIDPNWRPATAHEAPPCSGVLGVYNRSDRQRWYWCCTDCNGWFEAKPGLSLFSTLPPEDELLQMVRAENLPKMAAHHAVIACPHCASIIKPTQKYKLNQAGRWLADGQRIEKGEVVGEYQRSSIAGYWLGGVAAAYQQWDSLVLRYLQGLREYDLTGSEEALQTTINTDQGMPYLSRLLSGGEQSRPSDRTEALPRYEVPDSARFLVAAVDVQGGKNSRFVCQVHAIGEGLEQWIVDRFSISTSPRGTPDNPIQIDPAGFSEDWDAITQKLVNATYKTSTDRELRVKLTVVDTGGEAGTSANAYQWFRRVIASGLSPRVMLVKGGAQKPATPVMKANARDARGHAIKDIRLHLLDTDFFKDIVASSLKRPTAGAGYMHFPDWLPATFYEELSAERRDKKGKWQQVRSRNEALDLWVYVLAGVWALGAHKIDWEKPPSWARNLESNNSESMEPEDRRAMKAQPPPPPVKPITLARRQSTPTRSW